MIPAAAIFALLLTLGGVPGLAVGSASLQERGAAPAASPSVPAIVSSNVASGDTSWSTPGTETLFSAGLPSVDAGGSVLAFVDISGWYPGMVATVSDSLGNGLRPVASGTVGSDYLALYAADAAAGGTNDVIRVSGPVSNGTSYGWVLIVASLYPTVRPSVNDYSVDYSESGTTTGNATVAPTLALYAQIVDYGPTVFSSHSPASMLTYSSDSYGLTSLGVSYENVSSVGLVSMSMATNSGDSPVVGLLVLLDDVAQSAPHWTATGACAPNHTEICVPLLGGTAAPKNLDPNIVTCARNSGVSGGCEPLFGTDPNTGAFYVWANDEYGPPSIPDDTVGWDWHNGTWTNVTAGSNVQVFGYTLGDSYGTPTCMAWIRRKTASSPSRATTPSPRILDGRIFTRTATGRISPIRSPSRPSHEEGATAKRARARWSGTPPMASSSWRPPARSTSPTIRSGRGRSPATAGRTSPQPRGTRISTPKRRSGWLGTRPTTK